MTVQDLYLSALALLGEKSTVKGYSDFKIPLTNQLLAECFNTNNTILASKGLTELTEIPTVTLETDVLTYDTKLARLAMPYGLASLLVIDDDKQKSAAFSQMYETNRKKCSVAVSGNVTDYYSEVE